MTHKIGAKIQWKWLGRNIQGVVKKIFFKPVTLEIKGKKITRKGSEENPAYLVLSAAGNEALKLGTELSIRDTKKASQKTSSPKMFEED